MQTVAVSALVVFAFLYTMSSAAAQTPVGALAVDERQGERYGWAVDYETAGAAQARALSECGPGCRVVLTFEGCAAYAADQDADSTAVGWAESFASAAGAQQAALSECSSRGGRGCIVRVWGCNGPAVEEGLELDRTARQQIQRGLQAAGFDSGGADGVFGPRTRAAIRGWQTSRGSRATGYLDAASVAVLRSAASGPAVVTVAPPAPPANPAPRQPPVSSEVELVFWQSIVDSTNAADFEAYLAQFPNGVFRALARNRLSALRASVVGGVGAPAAGLPPTAADVSGAEPAAGVDARGRPGAVFRPDRTCAGEPAGTACWKEVSGRPGCYVWDPELVLGQTVTWPGECSSGLARGTGSLTWVFPNGDEMVTTGRLRDGKPHGDWVVRAPDGDTSVWRFENGQLVERR